LDAAGNLLAESHFADGSQCPELLIQSIMVRYRLCLLVVRKSNIVLSDVERLDPRTVGVG
jgi:hypothetical protein